MVRIYEMKQSDGKAAEIVVMTDCNDERDFLRQLSEAMAKLNGKGGALFLESTLRRTSDIVCRYRGYKNDVKERKLMLAGEVWPAETIAPVASAETRAAIETDENLVGARR